jgi:hypothetical protein
MNDNDKRCGTVLHGAFGCSPMGVLIDISYHVLYSDSEVVLVKLVTNIAGKITTDFITQPL